MFLLILEGLFPFYPQKCRCEQQNSVGFVMLPPPPPILEVKEEKARLTSRRAKQGLSVKGN